LASPLLHDGEPGRDCCDTDLAAVAGVSADLAAVAGVSTDLAAVAGRMQAAAAVRQGGRRLQRSRGRCRRGR
jgi:hypothetical protein